MLFTIKTLSNEMVVNTEFSSAKLYCIEEDLHKVMDEVSVKQLKIELILTIGALKLEFEPWINDYYYGKALKSYLLHEIEMLFLLHLEKWVAVDLFTNIISPANFLKERYRLLLKYPFAPTEEDLLDFDAATDAAMLYCMVQDNKYENEDLKDSVDLL